MDLQISKQKLTIITKCSIWDVAAVLDVDLHRSKKIPSYFDAEIPLIREKFMKADYKFRFTESVVNEFKRVKNVEMKVL